MVWPFHCWFLAGIQLIHCQRIQKFRETSNLKHFFRKELDKAYFDNDPAYSDSKGLPKKTISDKILKDRVYGIARICQYDEYQIKLTSMVYKSFDKKTGSGVSVNEQLAEESHNPVIKQLKRRNVYARFKGNICAVDLAEMGSLSSKSKNVKHVFTKYAWVKPL